MTKERWMDIGLGMEPHLKGIARIASLAGMDIVSIAATDSGLAWATYIDEDDRHYNVEVKSDGVTELSIDGGVFYTKN